MRYLDIWVSGTKNKIDRGIFLFQPTMLYMYMCVCVCYFNNICIITTPAFFNTFVSSLWSSKVIHRLSYVVFVLSKLIEIIQLKFLSPCF